MATRDGATTVPWECPRLPGTASITRVRTVAARPCCEPAWTRPLEEPWLQGELQQVCVCRSVHGGVREGSWGLSDPTGDSGSQLSSQETSEVAPHVHAAAPQAVDSATVHTQRWARVQRGLQCPHPRLRHGWVQGPRSPLPPLRGLGHFLLFYSIFSGRPPSQPAPRWQPRIRMGPPESRPRASSSAGAGPAPPPLPPGAAGAGPGCPGARGTWKGQTRLRLSLARDRPAGRGRGRPGSLTSRRLGRWSWHRGEDGARVGRAGLGGGAEPGSRGPPFPEETVRHRISQALELRARRTGASPRPTPCLSPQIGRAHV